MFLLLLLCVGQNIIPTNNNSFEYIVIILIAILIKCAKKIKTSEIIHYFRFQRQTP